MQWKRVEDSDNASGLSLYLTLDGTNWYHYTNPLFSMYRKPELNIVGASKGITTMQNCLKLKFKLVDKEGKLVN